MCDQFCFLGCSTCSGPLGSSCAELFPVDSLSEPLSCRLCWVQVTKNAPFLAERVKIFDVIKARRAEEMAAASKEAIKVSGTGLGCGRGSARGSARGVSGGRGWLLYLQGPGGGRL